MWLAAQAKFSADRQWQPNGSIEWKFLITMGQKYMNIPFSHLLYPDGRYLHMDSNPEVVKELKENKKKEEIVKR